MICFTYSSVVRRLRVLNRQRIQALGSSREETVKVQQHKIRCTEQPHFWIFRLTDSTGLLKGFVFWSTRCAPNQSQELLSKRTWRTRQIHRLCTQWNQLLGSLLLLPCASQLSLPTSDPRVHPSCLSFWPTWDWDGIPACRGSPASSRCVWSL